MIKTEDQRLPKGWVWVTLGDIVQPTRPKHNPGDYPDLSFIGMEHIEAHTMRLLGTVPANTMRSNAVHFMPHDVLYGRLRPYLNKVFSPDFEGLCSAEFIVFPYTKHLDMKYLQYLLNLSAFVSFASHLNEGDRPRVDFNQLSTYPIPLAPLPTQHRIVAEIDTQFTRLDAVVTAFKRVQANLKRYRASVLQTACEGRLVPIEAELARAEGRSYESADQLLQRILQERRAKWESEQLANMKTASKAPKDDRWKSKYREPAKPDTSELPELPAGWTWATVEQLASSEANAITDGPFGSNLKTTHYTSSGPRVIRLQNIGDGVFIDAYAHVSQAHYESLAKHRIKVGDLVIAALGERPPRACIIPPSVGPAIVKADCIRFKPELQVALAKYLNYSLNAESTRTRTALIVHGVGRPRLNLGEIKALMLPLPPFSEQQRIVAEVERRLSVIDELEAVIATNLKRADRLRQAILKRAFEGKLVPQDPTDEPASVLLERIRMERQRPIEKPKATPQQSNAHQPIVQPKATAPVQGELALGLRE